MRNIVAIIKDESHQEQVQIIQIKKEGVMGRMMGLLKICLLLPLIAGLLIVVVPILIVAVPIYVLGIFGIRYLYGLGTSDGIIYDVRAERKIKPIWLELEEKIKEECPNYDTKEHYRLGACHGYCAAQKRILKEDYGIDWRTPAELNPNTRFD